MAQTGFTPILLYSSTTASQAPSASNLTNSTLGSELAINITDGKLFYKDNANAIQVIGWKTVPTSAGGTGLTTYNAGDLLYYASGTTLSKLAIGANTNILTSSGSAPQWSAASGITVGKATNLDGGAAGSVPYQTGAGATSFVAIGTAYHALQVNAGGTAPSWQPSATSVLTTQGDLLYASAANTLARLAKNTTATRYLSNTGTNNNPEWAQVNLANGVTGVLPVANGGTNASSAGITAFNNITGYTASGATGTTSTNLVFSTSPSLTTPRVITSINDTNGNELFGVTATASAVNELTIANAATGNAPTLSATGSDTNISITLAPKGTGAVRANTSLKVVPSTGDSMEFATKTTTVGTAATTIGSFANDWGQLAIVTGLDGGGNFFTDLVFNATTAGPTVLSAKSISGGPAARTYTQNGSSEFQLAMGSGSYSVRCAIMYGLR